MTARFMRAEFFQFRPTHKLWMYGNHKPVIRGTDNGIWRRIRAIPFTVTIPDDEVDPALPAKLRAELPGILAWAVAGCQAWQTQGLGTAAAVSEATASYRAEMDVLGGFLDARCVIAPHAKAGATALYRAYKAWAEEAGEFVMSQRRFGGQLTERGFGQTKDSAGLIHRSGIGLLAEGHPPDDPRTNGGSRTNTYISATTPLSHGGYIHVPPASSVPPEIVRSSSEPASDEPLDTDDPSPALALAERLRQRRDDSNG